MTGYPLVKREKILQMSRGRGVNELDLASSKAPSPLLVAETRTPRPRALEIQKDAEDHAGPHSHSVGRHRSNIFDKSSIKHDEEARRRGSPRGVKENQQG